MKTPWVAASAASVTACPAGIASARTASGSLRTSRSRTSWPTSLITFRTIR